MFTRNLNSYNAYLNYARQPHDAHSTCYTCGKNIALMAADTEHFGKRGRRSHMECRVVWWKAKEVVPEKEQSKPAKQELARPCSLKRSGAIKRKRKD